LSNAATFKAGQYVTIDASEHLDFGYSHMRDDDPRSLNDDFVRTFTVSSPPGLPPHPSKRLADDEFEITIRKVGVVTDLLFRHGLKKGAEFEVGVKGFGGEFVVEQTEEKPVVAFIAAGVGITPLMPCLTSLELGSLRLLWTLRAADLGLALDMITNTQGLAQSLTLFVTGMDPASDDDKRSLKNVEEHGVQVEYRRMEKGDLKRLMPEVRRWYICTGTGQRSAVLQWLSGQEVLYEDYNF